MDALHQLVGSDASTIVWWQMVCRGIVIFFYTLLLVRVGGRRIFGKYTSFDIVLGVILGSVMSRALTGNARLVPVLVTASVLVLLNWILGEIAGRSARLARLIKGSAVLLVKDGDFQRDAMRKTHLTELDVQEALRANGGMLDCRQVRAAYFERNGDISVVPA
jgi:uncharacterized membrane protein YcaP (DUF421 family)